MAVAIDVRAVLRGNLGFEYEDLERWLPFATAAKFRPQRAISVRVCPDCGRAPVRALGRYISFGTLIQLNECPCGLNWANARIDAASSARHFDRTYVDEAYFTQHRRAVFTQMTTLVAARTPSGGRVLDIGGAGGQLATVIREARPDLAITVHDVSPVKIAQAHALGFETLCGDAHVFKGHTVVYDTIVLCDSIYYEPDLPALWEALRAMRRPGGRILIRVPNLVSILRLAGMWQSWSRRLPVSLWGHNLDHLVVCTHRYLAARLEGAGCSSVSRVPSPIGEVHRRYTKPLEGGFLLARAFHAMTGWCLTPSMVVIGED